MPVPIVDVHTHASNYHQLKDGTAEAEVRKLLDDMAVGNVDRSVVLPMPTPARIKDAETHNTLFLEQIAPHDNLVPFCTVDLHDAGVARQQVRKAVEQGARGIKFMHIVQEARMDGEASMAACEEAVAHDIPVLLHTGQGLPAQKELSGEGGELGLLALGDPLPIDGIAARLPELRLVIAHFGWPWTDVALAIMQRRRNVWIDLSGWAPKHVPDTVWTQLNKVHPNRFMFGTDFPLISSERWLREFRQHVPNPEVAEMVLGGNSAEYLGSK